MAIDTDRKLVLFIGSFKSLGEDGNVGGQMFACRSLVNSQLNKKIDFKTIDTTASTNKQRGFAPRLYGALKRKRKFLGKLSSDVDVVMAFCSSSFSFLEKGTQIIVAKALGKKTVLAPRSGYLLDNLERSAGFKQFAKLIFSACDVILCQGQFWQVYFHQELNVPENKLFLRPNWIDIADYPFVEQPIHEQERIQLLFLGWIDENKGVLDLVETARLTKDLPIDWHFAGDGVAMDQLRRKVENYQLTDSVFLHGWVHGKEKKVLLEKANLFVLPSYREGLPNAILEAMATGIPVLTSPVGAIPDVVKHQQNGWLVQPGDVSAMESILRKVMKDPTQLRDMGKCARKQIEDHHDLSGAVADFSVLLTGMGKD